MKKYFLTTALMGTFIAPAFGADKIITSANTCTVDVLGVSDNNAVANTIATWDLKDYECPAGQYLLETETNVECTECPTGSYCPGGTYTVESENNGKNTCPTTHPNSAEGAGADTQCYTACTVDMVAKATAVTGNDYFGSGVDTCEPTACVAGWHVKPGLNIGETIGEETGSNSAYIKNDGTFSEMNYDGKGAKGQEYYGISGPMSFAVDYAGKGILTGHGRCSTQPGVREFDYSTNTAGEITIVNTLADETGQEGAQYCYCQVDGFTPVGGTKAIVTSAPWVFDYDYGLADLCAGNCAGNCAFGLRYDDVNVLAFRAAVMNGLPVSSATCAANTINIDWNPDNGGDHIKNMCTYDGAVTLPTPDPVKPGYTFMGWKLLENTTTE